MDLEPQLEKEQNQTQGYRKAIKTLRGRDLQMADAEIAEITQRQANWRETSNKQTRALEAELKRIQTKHEHDLQEAEAKCAEMAAKLLDAHNQTSTQLSNTTQSGSTHKASPLQTASSLKDFLDETSKVWSKTYKTKSEGERQVAHGIS